MLRIAIAVGVSIVLSIVAAARGDIRTDPVEYHDGDTLLRGYIAYDDTTEEVRPAVLVLPEWWGLTDYPKRRAQMLAQLGYVAFVADLYGNGQATADPDVARRLSTPFYGGDRTLLRQRARAGLDTLLAQKRVDKGRVAAIGYCFGGLAALELARSGAPLAGIVTFHGDLSRTPAEGPDHIGACKILVCHGGDDQLVPPAVLAAFEQEMKQEHADYQINIYSGAKHAFTNPAADSYHMPPVGYNAQADHRSWAAAKDFFEEIFRR
jgi:dienelactone hydrolase